jgi:mono/diheme cytochrome c family protein
VSRNRCFVTLLLSVVTLTGCDWFSTMSRTPSIQPYEVEPLLPPERSVALDGMGEFNLATADELVNPTPSSVASTANGEASFRDFCIVCHGEGGRGGGPMEGQYPAIPTLTTGRLDDFSDGYLFALITQGRGLMPGYSRIQQGTRWDLVNYLRSLPVQAAASGAPAEQTGGS